MYSKEHLLFLKKLKRENLIVKFFRVFIILFFIFLWQFLADLDLINTFITSSPKMVINTLLRLKNEGLFLHIITTVYETVISLSLIHI